MLPTGHMPNPGNQTCNVCHTAAPTNYATLAANSVLHTGISSGCGQCHGAGTQLTFYNNNDNPKDNVLTPAHIPYLAGTDCGSCHTIDHLRGGRIWPDEHDAGHPRLCRRPPATTCHEAGVSFYMGAANPALQGRPADHTSGQMVAPNDCSICHTTANWNSTVMPAGHMPNPAQPGMHGLSYQGARGLYDHDIGGERDTAHRHHHAAASPATARRMPTPPVFYPSYTPKDAVLSPVHIPTSSTACEACHAISFTSFSGTTMSSAKHTSMFAVIGKTCDACHDDRPAPSTASPT